MVRHGSTTPKAISLDCINGAASVCPHGGDVVMRNARPSATLIDQLARSKGAPKRLRAAAPVNDNDTGWWMITLSDLTMLMIGFLVIWYATGKTGTNSPSPVQTPRTVIFQNTAAIAPLVEPLEKEDWQAVHQDLVRFIGSAGLDKDVDIESTSGEIMLSLRDNVPFASGKAELRPRALPVLEKIAAVVLGNITLSVGISGHTDSLRIATAEFPSNWELSTARASRVARYLIEKGIHPARISVQGFANYRPRNPNSTETDRRTNRRVEIRLFHQVPATGGEDSQTKESQ
jgi:chemotaxis protein MotB